jgi:hypothetical protein
MYIAKYRTANRLYGYNVTLGGEGTRGHRHSEETKEKMRLRRIVKPYVHSEESKAKIGASLRGRKHRPETREKISRSHMGLKRGIKVSPESIAKMIETRKRNGIKMPEHVKEMLREINKGHTYNVGRKHTTEAKSKISAAHIGHKVSEETRSKMSMAAKLRGPRSPVSEETRIKMREAQLATWKARKERAAQIHGQGVLL